MRGVDELDEGLLVSNTLEYLCCICFAADLLDSGKIILYGFSRVTLDFRKVEKNSRIGRLLQASDSPKYCTSGLAKLFCTYRVRLRSTAENSR